MGIKDFFKGVFRGVCNIFGETCFEESKEAPPDSTNFVLRWNLIHTTTNKTVSLEYSGEKFKRFYGCLCKKCALNYIDNHSDGCTMTEEHNCDIYANRYRCYTDGPNIDRLSCQRLLKTDADLSDCLSYTSLDKSTQDTCKMNDLEITWHQKNILQKYSYDDKVLRVSSCSAENLITSIDLEPTTITTPIDLEPTNITTSIDPETTNTTLSDTSLAPEVTQHGSFPTTYGNDTIVSSVSPNSSFETFIDNNEMKNEEDNTFIIIGVVLGLCVAAAILVALGVVLWRRKKRALTAGQDVQKSPEEYEMDRSDNPAETGSGGENQAGEYSYADINMETIPGNDSNNAHQNSKIADDEHYTIVNSEDNQASGGKKVSDVSSPNGVYTYVDNSADVKLHGTDGRAFHPQDGDDDGCYSVVTVSHNNVNKGAYPGNNSLAQNPWSEVKDADRKNNDTERITKDASKKDKITPAGDEYSRLHEVHREIENPYNLLPDTDPKNEYSRLHETQRHFQDPYNFLPGPQTSTSRQPLENSISSNLDIGSETPTYSSVLPKSERC